MTSSLERELHDAINLAIRSSGRPSATQIVLVEDRLSLRYFEATLVDGQSVWIVVPRAGLPRAPLEHLRAATRLLKRHEQPVPTEFRSVWSNPLQCRLALRSPPEGLRASVLLHRKQLDSTTLFGALGRFLASRPSNHQAAGWADDTGFVSMSSFREVMVRSAKMSDACIGMAALDPGPAGMEVFARFTQALEHADFPVGCALTHGGLGPTNLRFEEGEIVEFEGWTHSMLGDPMFDWGVLYHFGIPAVDDAIDAAGGIELEPNRLAVGYYGKLVLDIGTFASLMCSSPDPQRSELNHFLHQSLERCLDSAPKEWARRRARPCPDPVWYRIADIVRSLPPPDTRTAIYVAGAIAAMQVEQWTPEERTHYAHRCLDSLRPGLLAPSDSRPETSQSHPLILKIFESVREAFNGTPPFGFESAALQWGAGTQRVIPQDAFEALREALVLSWLGNDDVPNITEHWDIVSWRAEGSLTPEQALEEARTSPHPLDLCRVLGALRLRDGPPQDKLLSVLFNT